MVEFRQPTTDKTLRDAAEQVHHAWNDALARKDPEALAALYAEDAIIESPLVAYLLGTERPHGRADDDVGAVVFVVHIA
jgi:ketosteroid isomerase-like protein